MIYRAARPKRHGLEVVGPCEWRELRRTCPTGYLGTVASAWSLLRHITRAGDQAGPEI